MTCAHRRTCAFYCGGGEAWSFSWRAGALGTHVLAADRLPTRLLLSQFWSASGTQARAAGHRAGHGSGFVPDMLVSAHINLQPGALWSLARLSSGPRRHRLRANARGANAHHLIAAPPRRCAHPSPPLLSDSVFRAAGAGCTQAQRFTKQVVLDRVRRLA